MVLNSQTTLYGVEPVKSVSYDTKSKGGKKYGLKFPFGDVSEGNFLKKSSDLELIKSNLRQLLRTSRGERPMLPNFGTNLKNYLMEPLDQYLLNQIRLEILESINTYATNVRVNKLQILFDESSKLIENGALIIKLYCSIAEEDNVNFEVKIEVN